MPDKTTFVIHIVLPDAREKGVVFNKEFPAGVIAMQEVDIPNIDIEKRNPIVTTELYRIGNDLKDEMVTVEFKIKGA